MASITIKDLSLEQRAGLYKPKHPAYKNPDRLKQVLDNIKSFGPVVNIGKFGISFKNGVFQFFSMESKIEDVNDYDYPDNRSGETSSE